MSDDKDLFRALELAHYAERFRDRTFVIALPASVSFRDLLLDFKVLAGYHIRVVLVTQDPGFQLDRIIAVANKRGARFHLSLLTDVLLRPGEQAPGLDFQRIEAVLRQGRMPIIAYHGAQTGEPGDPQGVIGPTCILGAEVAVRLGAQKLFLIHGQARSMGRVLGRSHVLANEMAGLPERLTQAGLSGAGTLFGFIREQLERGVPDVVLLEGKTAALFNEVFTHDGGGLLFNATGSSRIRPAVMKDITDIALLLRPEVEAGRIRSFGENEIEANLRYYRVYEIDGLLVGSVCLKSYGEAAELSQFTTLPRYRGKGRARELALHLTGEAACLGFRRVFALSTDARMWEFFQGLGFRPVDRESLPQAWRDGYDMNRPSRAFLKDL